jgi:hypothetical protein
MKEIKENILVNALVTPDGTVIESRSRWDYHSYVDSITGKTYMVDGGLDYVRCCSQKDGKVVTLYAGSPHSELREFFRWGTYGKSGNEPHKLVKLKDMETSHINSIITTQTHISSDIISMFTREISYRDSLPA